MSVRLLVSALVGGAQIWTANGPLGAIADELWIACRIGAAVTTPPRSTVASTGGCRPPQPCSSAISIMRFKRLGAYDLRALHVPATNADCLSVSRAGVSSEQARVA